jgi:NADH dehydrogenase
VVVGGGVAGLSAMAVLIAALKERPHTSLLLVSSVGHASPRIFLPELIGGHISANLAHIPLEHLQKFGPFSLTQDTVQAVDLERAFLKTPSTEIPFDYLLFAPGCNRVIEDTSNENCEPVVVGINNHETLKRCLSDIKERSPVSRVAIIGGGPLGVHLAASLSQEIPTDETDENSSPSTSRTITLIDKNPFLLSGYPDAFKKYALRTLRKMGIGLHLGQPVRHSKHRKMEYLDGSPVDADLIIWTPAGTPKTEPLTNSTPDRLIVDQYLRLSCGLNFFAAGSAFQNSLEKRENPDCSFPITSAQMGRLAARNLVASLSGRRLTAIHEEDLITSIAIGPNKAIAQVRGVTLKGISASAVHRLTMNQIIPDPRGRAEHLGEWTQLALSPYLKSIPKKGK